MIAGRDYRRLAGLLLLWGLLPLPFMQIILPPFWAIAGAVAVFLLIWPDRTVRLRPWVQNVLGVLIVVAVISAGGFRVGPLRPLGHLLLSLTSVRVLGVADRRSFLRAFPALFLVWLVSLTVSTHVTVLVYFVLSAAIWWWAGMRIHLMAIAERFGEPIPTAVRPQHAVVAAAMALLLAVPLFMAVPRLRSPWIAGRGGMHSVTGFSSRVELSGVGTIHESFEQAVVVRSPNGERIRPEWMRLRAAAFERVTVDSFAPRRADRMPRSRGGIVWLHPEDLRLGDMAELEIELLRPRRYLFLPPGAVALSSPLPVRLDPSGGVKLARRVREPLRYTVWLSREESPRLDPPHRGGRAFEPHPEVNRLAASVTAGVTGAAERAVAVESHLRGNYRYSLQGMTRFGPDPVAWFLLRSREGHCEYFAGGMVVMLEAIGVPARMVGGYSGGTASPSGTEVIVREANAHTWVEVWQGPQQGWVVYDPTPAAGVPTFQGLSAGDRLRFAWEWVQASWDRYVLTFGLGEQVQLLAALGDGLAAALARLAWRDLMWPLVTVASLWLLVLAVRRWRWVPTVSMRRRRPPAARVVERLARRLERDGVELPAGSTVRRIGHSVQIRWPQAAAAVAELVWRAERELYAEAGVGAEDPASARKLWTRLRRETRPRNAR